MMSRPDALPIVILAAVAFLLTATVYAQGGTGGVEGVVSVNAAQEPKRPPRYYLDSKRSTRKAGKVKAPTENVVVYATRVPPTRTGGPPDQRPRMVQRFESFRPHVLPVLAGTTIEFPNEDDFYHNVFSVVAGDRFDLGRFGEGKSQSQRFDKAGVVVVRCEIHSGMKAYIRVLDTPHFATADSTGRFSLDDLPAGGYTLRAWHPVAGETVPRSLDVQSGRITEVELAF